MAETHLPSLLRAPDADAAPEPRYVLPDEAGVIYVDPTLRRRACKWGTSACNKAVLDVFAKLREHLAAADPPAAAPRRRPGS